MINKRESVKAHPQVIIPPDWGWPYDPWDEGWTLVGEGDDPAQITEQYANYFQPGSMVKLKLQWNKPLLSWLPFGWGVDYTIAFITTNILKILNEEGALAWEGQFVDVVEDVMTIRLKIREESYSTKTFGIAPAVIAAMVAILVVIKWLAFIFGPLFLSVGLWKLFEAPPEKVQSEVAKIAEIPRTLILSGISELLKPWVWPAVIVGGGWLALKIIPSYFKK